MVEATATVGQGAILGSWEHRMLWEVKHVTKDGFLPEMDPRRNLESYLRMYFAGLNNLPKLSITVRETDGVGGKRLRPSFVSRLEVAQALSRLECVNLLGSVVLRLALGMPADPKQKAPGWRTMARMTGHSMGDVQDAYEAAITWLVDHIYDWTPAGQRLAAEAEAECEKARKRAGL